MPPHIAGFSMCDHYCRQVTVCTGQVFALSKIDDKISKAAAPLADVTCLREENARLRSLLIEHGIPIPEIPGKSETPKTSHASSVTPEAFKPTLGTAEQRIALFRSSFRGRDDVYAVRWENADRRSGYMPKADRDWKSYLRAKDQDRKKVDRQTRKFRPITDDVVRGHLIGEHIVGVYPLLQDETCWFLAVDFDKKTWQKDASAFLAVCGEMNVPAAVERSRSGNGGHVWMFFDQAIPASIARRLGCAILTRTLESRHQVGLDSYDRFFPNQDTMPKGGLGNADNQFSNFERVFRSVMSVPKTEVLKREAKEKHRNIRARARKKKKH